MDGLTFVRIPEDFGCVDSTHTLERAKLISHEKSMEVLVHPWVVERIPAMRFYGVSGKIVSAGSATVLREQGGRQKSRKILQQETIDEYSIS